MEFVGEFCIANEFPSPAGRKTKFWQIVNGPTLLGSVKWFAKWRAYAFFPALETVFEKQCLRAIADFCETKTKEHKQASKVKS